MRSPLSSPLSVHSKTELLLLLLLLLLNLKDTLVRAKLPNSDDGGLSVKGCYKCNGRKSCQICGLIKEGDSFENSDENRSFKILSGRYNCNSENVVYLLQCECCRKKYVGSTKTKFRQRFNVYKSYFRSYARKRDQGTLERGKIIPFFRSRSQREI